jgi:hypothetical protein
VFDTDYHDRVAPVTLDVNQLNRVVYNFRFTDLPAGPHVLTYEWRISPTVGCFASGKNDVHLKLPGQPTNTRTDIVNVSVRCPPGAVVAPPSAHRTPPAEAHSHVVDGT